jgi:hypothetical protein
MQSFAAAFNPGRGHVWPRMEARELYRAIGHLLKQRAFWKEN